MSCDNENDLNVNDLNVNDSDIDDEMEMEMVKEDNLIKREKQLTVVYYLFNKNINTFFD